MQKVNGRRMPKAHNCLWQGELKKNFTQNLSHVIKFVQNVGHCDPNNVWKC